MMEIKTKVEMETNAIRRMLIKLGLRKPGRILKGSLVFYNEKSNITPFSSGSLPAGMAVRDLLDGESVVVSDKSPDVVTKGTLTIKRKK